MSPLREPVRAPAPAKPASCADFFAAVEDGVATGIERAQRAGGPPTRAAPIANPQPTPEGSACVGNLVR